MILITALMLFVVAAIYFLEYRKNQIEFQDQVAAKRPATSEGLQKIVMTSPGQSFQLQLNKERWWLVEPFRYPADQGAMEQVLTLMNQVVADSVFTLEEDRFGFNPGRARLLMTYENGDVKELVLGDEEGPGSLIYLLDVQSQKVFAVHNVWGQLFYKRPQDLVDPYFTFRHWNIDSIELVKEKSPIWFLKKQGERWQMLFQGKTLSLEHKDLIWFLRKLKDAPAGPDEFDVEPPAWPYELVVKAGDKEERVLVSSDGRHIYQNKAVANLEGSFLESLENQLAKVMKSAEPNH